MMSVDKEGQEEPGPEPSCVSVKSNNSIHQPPNLNPETATPESDFSCCCHCSQDNMGKSVTSVETTIRYQSVKDNYKMHTKSKYETLSEGKELQKNQTLLNRIYTQVYIIEGERGEVNEEHELIQMEKTQHSLSTQIKCNDIFKPVSERQRITNIKTVLTKGIAGIGKTVSVQKFILDWAEGEANQDVDFMFVLPFRELNLIGDHQYSLHTLLLDLHPELPKDLDCRIYEECKVVFICDGLDESKITLMFSDCEKVSDVTETSSVSVLMSNLIRGDLSPSAFIWITSRPGAASQIPATYIHRVTEIQGFNDPQKEEYFRKTISDEHQSSRIISHIRGVKSLHVMCHIPIFCWISATVLQNTIKHRAKIPQTLTEMYIHFLLIQINVRTRKYEERDPEKLLQSNRDIIVKLSELAFKQLMKGNVMFYEEDLIEIGIDVTDASVYSGICTEIFKEESVIHQRKVYCFVHLSFQEFLAAFYVFYSHVDNNTELLQSFLDDKYETYRCDDSSLFGLLKLAVCKTLESKDRHLDLFLRFLLGISLESNQTLLRGLLTHTEKSSDSIEKTTDYIKGKFKDDHDLLAKKSIKLLYCLFEIKDQTLHQEILEFVKSDKHSWNKLSAAHCSAIAYMLQMLKADELDLKKCDQTEKAGKTLLPAVNCGTSKVRGGCNHSDECCPGMSSLLEELERGDSNLQKSRGNCSQCPLEKLRMALSKHLDKSSEDLILASQASSCLPREKEPSSSNQESSSTSHCCPDKPQL